jgi:hypothetical protein
LDENYLNATFNEYYVPIELENHSVDAVRALYIPSVEKYYEYDKNSVGTDVNTYIQAPNEKKTPNIMGLIIPDGIRRVGQIDISFKVSYCVYYKHCIVQALSDRSPNEDHGNVEKAPLVLLQQLPLCRE